MKKLMLGALAATLMLPVQGQLFSSESLGGAVLGGLAGGIIGHNNGRKSAEGAAIGAGAGLLLGTIAGQARREREATYYSAPSYGTTSYYQSRPNYAVGGAVLGGIAGGVIGHNNGRKTGEGIAIGAGAGLLLGAVAEQHARRQERAAAGAVVVSQPAYVVETPVVAVAPAATVVTQTEAQPQPQQNVTIVNHNYYNSQSSTMSGANALFGR